MRMITTSRRGFSLIEILVAIGIIVVALVFMMGGLVLGTRIFTTQTQIREAIFVAEEGAEALRFVRDADWTSNVTPLIPGITYYAVRSGANWVFQINNPGVIQGRYTRTVVLARVYRDASGNIVSSGTEDTQARSFIITVTWNSALGAQSVVQQGYVMNILGDT